MVTRAHSLTHTLRPYALALSFFSLLLLPGIVISNYLVEGAVGVFFTGAVPVAAAVFGGASRAAIPVTLFLSVSGALAIVFHPSVALSTLLMVTVAAIIGIVALRGLHSPVMLVGVMLGFLVVTPPEFAPREYLPWSSISPWFATFALLLLGGLWATLIGFALRSTLPVTPPLLHRTPSVVIPYTLSLSISTGLATFVVLTFWPGGVGAWVILTIFVIIQPEQDVMRNKIRERVLGTLAGALVALLAIGALQGVGRERTGVQLIIALIFLALAMRYYLPGPYWKYVIYLTPGIVLLDSHRSLDQTDVDLLRVMFTLAGATIAVLVATGVHRGSRALIALRK